MISFRYHIVSIVSVFLALAVGVALGGGPLKGEVDNSLVEQVEADRKAKADLRAEIAALRTGDGFTDSFAQTVAPSLIGGSLKGRPVTLMVLPGAQEEQVTSMTEFIGQAGGSVGGTIRVGEGLVDVGNKQLVDELGSQLLDGTPDLTVPEDASGYDRLGTLLARADATGEDAGAAMDDEANSIISGLSTADLMSPAGELSQRGSLVVFISAPETSGGNEGGGAGAIVAALATAMDAGTDGVVVAGPISSAQDGGVIGEIRKDVVAAKEVSTVDVLGRAAGQLVTVLALAEQAKGTTGHYGAVNAANGAMPGAAPTD